MSPEQRAENVISLLKFDGSWNNWALSEVKHLIATAIREAECATEERCFRASEELCAKIAEMHDELERLRNLKSQEP